MCPKPRPMQSQFVFRRFLLLLPLVISKIAISQPFTISTVFSQSAGDGSMRLFQGIATDTQGNVYVSDNNRHQVLKRSSSGTVTVIAGTGLAGYNGDNIQATSAALYNPTGLAMDLSGNLFIVDS